MTFVHTRSVILYKSIGPKLIYDGLYLYFVIPIIKKQLGWLVERMLVQGTDDAEGNKREQDGRQKHTPLFYVMHGTLFRLGLSPSYIYENNPHSRMPEEAQNLCDPYAEAKQGRSSRVFLGM